jgi:hypothetical protein
MTALAVDMDHKAQLGHLIESLEGEGVQHAPELGRSCSRIISLQ